jgi:hypothetical protein
MTEHNSKQVCYVVFDRTVKRLRTIGVVERVVMARSFLRAMLASTESPSSLNSNTNLDDGRERERVGGWDPLYRLPRSLLVTAQRAQQRLMETGGLDSRGLAPTQAPDI